jgi:hypothetical protein
MGMVFRLMTFLLMFNLAAGMCAYMFGINMIPTSAQAGIQQVDTLNNQFSTSAGVPIEETSFWYRFLDIVSLGFYNKIKLFLNSTIFSIPTILVNVHLLDPGLLIYINGFITTILILGMFELITGRDLFGR